MTIQPALDDLEALWREYERSFFSMYQRTVPLTAEEWEEDRIARQSTLIARIALETAIREAARRPLVEALEEAVVYADASRRRMAERNDVFSDGQAATWEQHSYILRQIIERFTE